MLDLNDAGRVLLPPKEDEDEDDYDGDRNNGDYNHNDGNKWISSRFSPLPLAIWPTVLERADGQKGYHPSVNAVYHLLRHGPVVVFEKDDEMRRRRNHKHKHRPAAGSDYLQDRKRFRKADR